MSRLSRSAACSILFAALAGVAALTACGDSGPDTTPATVQISPGSAASLQSGATLSLSASVLNVSGSPLTLPVTWQSSNTAVAAVSGGIVTAAKAGQASITASAGPITSAPVVITVTPGPATKLVVVRQPAASVVGAPLTSQPSLEVHDAGDNVVTTASVAVTAAVATGNGRLGGTFTVSATNGVATFADLAVIGKIGDYSLTFSGNGVAPATSQVFPVALGAAAQLGIRNQPAVAASGVALAHQPIVEVEDAGGNFVSAANGAVTASIAQGNGTLSGTTTLNTSGGVATFTDLTIVGLIGDYRLVFASPGFASATSFAFPLVAGAATQLAIKTVAGAATSGVALDPPPIIDVRDGAGNTATSSTAVVTATVATGSATITNGSATAVNGSATFSNFTLTGAAGAVTLSFASPGLTSATSSSIALSDAPPAKIAFSVAADTVHTRLRLGTAADTVDVVNAGGASLSSLTVQSVTYASGEKQYWLTAALKSTTAPTKLTLVANPALLDVGTYHATVTLAGAAANSPQSLPVVLTVAPAVAYGASNAKVLIVDVGTTATPSFSITDTAGGTVADNTISFAARAPSVAAVSSSGTITASAPGESWVAAVTPEGSADSVFVIVPGSSTSPILRTDLTKYAWTLGDTVTVTVILDTRSTTKLGAITGVVSWTNDATSGVLSFIDASTTNSPLAPTIAVDASIGTIRFSGASTTGASGPVELMRIRFLARPVHAGFIYLNASEVVGTDMTNLLPVTTMTHYPVIAK